MDNPYSPPSADVEVSGESNIHVFDRFSAWGVFGLSLITFGIYAFYWLYTRSKIVNANVDDKISSTIINGSLIALIGNWVFSILAEVIPDNDLIVIIGSLVSIAYLVFYLIWIYAFRARLQIIANAGSSEGKYKLGGIMTFFFNVLYFQYKINQIIDDNPQ